MARLRKVSQIVDARMSEDALKNMVISYRSSHEARTFDGTPYLEINLIIDNDRNTYDDGSEMKVGLNVDGDLMVRDFDHVTDVASLSKHCEVEVVQTGSGRLPLSTFTDSRGMLRAYISGIELTGFVRLRKDQAQAQKVKAVAPSLKEAA